MIALTTKYTLKKIPAFLIFVILSDKSIEQAKNSHWLVTIKISFKDLRTLTVWQDMEDLRAFRDSGIHLKAMKDSHRLGFNRSCTWQTDTIPSWKEVISKLNKKSFRNDWLQFFLASDK